MKIYSAWLQGRRNAPNFVQKVFRLWEQLNPADTLHVVEQAEANAVLTELGVHQDRITPQVTTDLVRKALLSRTGGVWADATLLPTRPLADWLSGSLTSAGFFAFRSTGDENLALQNWFLCATQDNPLITEWLSFYAEYFRTRRLYPTWKRALYHARLTDYLRYRQKIARRDTIWFADPARGGKCQFYPYAISNYCFSYLIKYRPDLCAIWDDVPFRTAWLPSSIGYMAADKETTGDVFVRSAIEALDIAPVHKLNHRDSRFEILADVVLDRTSCGA